MRKSFASLNAPVLAGVLRRHDPNELKADIRNFELHGATALDFHLSCLDEPYRNLDTFREIVSFAKLPVLALNYRVHRDGQLDQTEEERVGLMMDCFEAGAAGIDMQGYTFNRAADESPVAHDSRYSFTEGDPFEIVTDDATIAKQVAVIDEVHAKGGEVLLSTHTRVPMHTEQLIDLVRFLKPRNPDILKIVTRADTAEQMVESFESMVALKKELDIPVHLHCVGPMGKLTRVVNPLLGGFLVFCNDGNHPECNFDQLDLQTMRLIYDKINLL